MRFAETNASVPPPPPQKKMYMLNKCDIHLSRDTVLSVNEEGEVPGGLFTGKCSLEFPEGKLKAKMLNSLLS